MNKKILLVTLLAVLPLGAMAAGENNVGSCGWGSKVFQGQRGLLPQIGATLTNGTSGNQTFAITSGTSGCTQDGLVSSNWKMAMFIDGNKKVLARDMSIGSGEALETLAKLIGVSDADKAAFYQAAKNNFARIFTSADVTTEQLMASLKQVLAANSELTQYSRLI
ncbi:MAG TPA: DUF3015 domain-containing protein [Acidiferrobacterales bacterium]|nr:DUF3015 domain-containing protein [Acidiferrobacterales bacterium]